MDKSDNIINQGVGYYFTETAFDRLMQKRIAKVLLICSPYDMFILEEDGRIDAQLFNEYSALNLNYPPQFIKVTNSDDAFEVLSEQKIDLVISMLSVGGMDPFILSKKIKSQYADIPIVVLTPFSREVSKKIESEDLSAIDYVFSWLGDAHIMLAIIKLIEDSMNAEKDVLGVGVQAILLVEDNVRYYSSYLPNMFKIVFKQSKAFMSEGLNEHQKMMRMRGRPKILMATNYEDALRIYHKYKDSLLGVISDISYPGGGIMDKNAGFKLAELVKSDDMYMPILLQSSQKKNEIKAKELRVGFMHKYSKTLSLELRDFIIKYMAFGDFKFVNPKTKKVIAKAANLKQVQEKIFGMPDDTIKYHIDRNHFSKWMNARALFSIASLFKELTADDFRDVEDVKHFLFDTIANFRINKGRGIVAKFYREKYDKYLTFTRIGEGYLGGKARGLAFIDLMIKKHRLMDKYKDVLISIPRTVVLSTDVFDTFMEENNLYDIALSELKDEEILKHFIQAKLPERYKRDIRKFLSVSSNPIAVRSSSLLEDSYYQPFAGIYSTYMIPNNSDDISNTVEMLANAVKSVYASVYYQDSKAYMKATSNVIDEEKMAVVLQEVCGSTYDKKFYPTFSGVARSINFYPIEPEKPENGIVNVALGLGKHIVDGGVTLRFSPAFPKKVLQLSSPDMALRETQKYFYALDLNNESYSPSVDDGVNILKLPIDEAEKDGTIKDLASKFDFHDNVIRDGINSKGKTIITFANILKYKVFPLAEILQDILKIGQKEMNNPIEIEFAVDLNKPKEFPALFNWLQIRPIVDNKETIDINLETVNKKETLIISKSALGNGEIDNVYDFVYVKPDKFQPAKTNEIAEKVDKINKSFIDKNKNYVLIGPGRWGTSDPWLGIPVKWPQISAARVIIESGLDDYRIDPSQGTHFFQNLTSFRVGYFTLNPHIGDGHYDLDFLNSIEPEYEDEYIRHVSFKYPILIKIDGKKRIGVIYKPENNS